MLVAPEGELRAVASSSEAMRLVELFELQAQEGPCLDCYRTRQPVLNQHLGQVEERWPRFEPVALEAGFRSVHALPMRLRGNVIGALNLFRSDRGDLDEADIVAGQALADVATITILQHRAVLESQLVNAQLEPRAQQPDRHRAGQGCPRERRHLDGSGLHGNAQHAPGITISSSSTSRSASSPGR